MADKIVAGIELGTISPGTRESGDFTENDDPETSSRKSAPESSTNQPKPTNSGNGTPSQQRKQHSQPTEGANGSDESTGWKEGRDYNRSDLHKSLENEFRTMATNYSKETVDSMDFLTESKDRAQLTANSAMSLSLVIVLKEILDQEVDARYHMVSLVLVVICLCLQVTVGFLALYMYQLKSKLSVFRKKAAVNPSRIEVDPERLRSAPSADLKKISDSLSFAGITTRAGQGSAGKDNRLASNSRGSLAAVAASRSSGLDKLNDTLLQMLTDMYADVLIDVQKIQIRLISAKDDEVNELEETLRRKSDVLKLLEAQLRITEFKNDAATRRDMLMKVTAVQNAITYLLYITFVINAFLTGFGISGNS